MAESQSRRSGGRRQRLSARHERREDTSMKSGTQIASPYAPLSEAHAKDIHRAALQILETVGMAKATPRVLKAALEHGCWQDDAGRLRFPPHVVEACLEKAAKSFVVHGRDPALDFEARNGLVNFATGGAAVTMLDRTSRTYRPSTLSDLYDLARVADDLTNIQWFARPVVATDVADNFDLDVNTIYACAAGTHKHIATSFTSGDHVRRCLPMLDLLAGGDFHKRPFCTVHATTVVSPMNFAEDSLDVACAAIDIGMPIHAQTGPQAGATAPAALAGTLVQVCAEGLASLCVINMLAPGHPVVMGNWAFTSDLRTGAFTGGGGEAALLGAASGQMSAFYGVPGGMGAGMSDSKLPDNQAGYEKALTMTLAALSGGGFVYESAGMLASLLGCSVEALIIDDEMLSSLRRVARGIEVTPDSLSVEVIKEAALGVGHFLGSEQTLKLMETEFTYPKHADRASPDDWADTGSTDIWDRARRHADAVLSGPSPSKIDTATDQQIREQYNILMPREVPV
ncbi:trimethylamine methyltransferase family protein [Shimia thalassica]|uniref:trimethylamine methyltransferase family protein n=1 Tax=Shimia thalassica TaxID=1715693 RepID=UPI001C09EF53|nr:trimethylamine methyltransferase family protein [Shimia thalassica]MBU2943156.1 trimethylamine methyltransferase family protein [Shimia thalassica]MDO6505305.1 trimethylamine methyltransferase family protein [Shimia thalassica]